MGEAKNKSARTALTDEMRAAMLGEDPFKLAYDFLFGMVEHVYTNSGGVNHELIGIDFDAGKPTGVHVLVVRRTEDVPRLREQMLQHWPMVAHDFEAWHAPDASVPASQHPQRYDVVSVMLNTSDMVAAASCRVDPGQKTIERGELFFPSGVGGRLGCELPTRH